MSCTTCCSNFSLLRKENECPYCKFSFCNKCLKKIKLPSGITKKVCNRCHAQISNKGVEVNKTNSNNNSSSKQCNETEANCSSYFPAPLKKSTSKQPKTNSLINNISEDILDNEKDIKIAERLKKLKEEEEKKIPTEDELRERLNRLKEDSPIHPPVNQPQTQKIIKVDDDVESTEDILNNILSIVEIDKKVNKNQENETEETYLSTESINDIDSNNSLLNVSSKENKVDNTDSKYSTQEVINNILGASSSKINSYDAAGNIYPTESVFNDNAKNCISHNSNSTQKIFYEPRGEKITFDNLIQESDLDMQINQSVFGGLSINPKTIYSTVEPTVSEKERDKLVKKYLEEVIKERSECKNDKIIESRLKRLRDEDS